MENINLLPESLKVKTSVVGLSKKLKKLSVILFVLLVAVVSISTGAFFFFTRELNDYVSSENELKTQIKALEETEQRLVLVKDRLKKVGDVYAKEGVQEEIQTFENILGDIPEGVTLETASLSTGDIQISITADSTSSFSQVLEALVNSGQLARIEMTAFGFSSKFGYKIGFLLARA